MEKIYLLTKEIVETISNPSPLSGVKSLDGEKIIWNEDISPTRKSIWIENFDGTGKQCLREATLD